MLYPFDVLIIQYQPNQPRADVVNALNHICDHWAYMAPLNGANCLNKAVRNVGAHQVHDLIG